MKKKQVIALIAAMSLTQITGCGAVEAKNKQIKTMDGLESSFSSALIFENSDQAILSEEKEADGSEELTEHKLLTKASMLSKPRKDAAVLGILDSDASIRVIELQEDGWAKVIYRGRVAYVERSAFEEAKAEETNEAAGAIEENGPQNAGNQDTSPEQKQRDDKKSEEKSSEDGQTDDRKSDDTTDGDKTEDKKSENKKSENTESGNAVNEGSKDSTEKEEDSTEKEEDATEEVKPEIGNTEEANTEESKENNTEESSQAPGEETSEAPSTRVIE